mmetsp:Transcript_50941/g.147888  ORF Transcript_50941/g.147888 Transcript_50941/m.147888 type:complete len:331 (-) Transcript_50941:348-1340(-)
MPPTNPRRAEPSMNAFWATSGAHLRRAARMLEAMSTPYAPSSRFLYGRPSAAGAFAAAAAGAAGGARSSPESAGKRLAMPAVDSSVPRKPPTSRTARRIRTPASKCSCTSGNFTRAGAKNSVAHFTRNALPGSTALYTASLASGFVSLWRRRSDANMPSMPHTDWMLRYFSSPPRATKKATLVKRTKALLYCCTFSKSLKRRNDERVRRKPLATRATPRAGTTPKPISRNSTTSLTYITTKAKSNQLVLSLKYSRGPSARSRSTSSSTNTETKILSRVEARTGPIQDAAWAPNNRMFEIKTHWKVCLNPSLWVHGCWAAGVTMPSAVASR